MNLLDIIRHLDLILCRDVVIYFTKPLQAMVYSNFVRVLNKDGFLVLGKAESPWGFAQKDFAAFDNREKGYIESTSFNIPGSNGCPVQ